MSKFMGLSALPVNNDNKTLLDYGYAPGNYKNPCHFCKEIYFGSTKAVSCKGCAEKNMDLDKTHIFTEDGITVEVPESGPVKCYEAKLDTTFPFDRDIK